MNTNHANNFLKCFLFICLVFLLSAGSVLAEEGGPPSEPGLFVEEGIMLTRPDGPGYSVGVSQSAPAFLPPPDSDPGMVTWTKLLQENFDGVFPSAGWTFYNYHPTGDYFWGADKYRSYSVNKSVHPGGAGADAYDPRASYYPDDMESWMTYGPLDLSTATDARFEFQMWLNNESDSDPLMVCASADDLSYYCWEYTGNSNGWFFMSLRLSDWNYYGSSLIGDASVWVGLIFVSDASTTLPGVFIDDLVVRTTSSAAEPDMHPLSYYLLPNLYHPGDSFSSYIPMTNLGSTACTDYDVTEYLSDDSIITSGDIEINHDNFMIPIDAGGYFFNTTTPLIPEAVTPGMYYAGVIISCVGDSTTINDTAVYNNQVEVAALGVGGVIFQDNFESHDLSAWTRYNPGKTGLSACSKGAFNGDHGACFYRPAGNDKRRQLIDETPVKQITFNVRFNFDINSLSIAEGTRFRFMQVKMGTERPFFIVLKYQGGQYLIQLNTLLDGIIKVKTGWYVLTDLPHTIEVDWQAASAPAANDGYVELYLDGVLLEALTGLDSHTFYVDTFKLGYTSRMDGKSISGTFLVDDVTTSNGGYIGLP